MLVSSPLRKSLGNFPVAPAIWANKLFNLYGETLLHTVITVTKYVFLFEFILRISKVLIKGVCAPPQQVYGLRRKGYDTHQYLTSLKYVSVRRLNVVLHRGLKSFQVAKIRT